MNTNLMIFFDTIVLGGMSRWGLTLFLKFKNYKDVTSIFDDIFLTLARDQYSKSK